jgi:hypothetical protein
MKDREINTHKKARDKPGVVIPTLRRLRQEDTKFKITLGYIARPCLKRDG